MSDKAALTDILRSMETVSVHGYGVVRLVSYECQVLLARITELEEALERLAVHTAPENRWVSDHWVCMACDGFACSLEAIEHEPDCAWVAAQEVMEEP